jgi:hypothetical protein
LIALHEVSAGQLGADRSVSFPSTAVSIREMVECLHRVGEGRALGPVSWSVDPVIQTMVSSWPHDVDAGRAVAAGIPAPDELDRIVREAADSLSDPGS